MSAGPALAATSWAPPTGERQLGLAPARHLLERAAEVLFALFIFFTCFTFLRPSPYDFLAIPAMIMWLLLGIRLHRAALLFILLLLLYHVGLLASLVPYLHEPDPVLWTFQSVYLMITCVFFIMFFGERSERRFDLAAGAYLASCFFAAAAGILSYFVPTGILFTMDGRAAGVFEDPNVLGSFLVFGVLFLLHRLVTGVSRFPALSVLGILLILPAIFLSFSRGSWASLVLGSLVTLGLAFRTGDRPTRRRVALLGAAAIALGAVTIAGLLSVGEIAETASSRFVVTKEYDEGETGRFGNQLRSIPMLAEDPSGFGPLRFRLRFGYEPHNSYIGGFANGGWLGGFAFLGMVLTTTFVGWRLCIRPSPYRSRAQIVFPALLMFFLQAMQIDIDHWRHVYFMMGMVWGLECARCRWAHCPVALPHDGVAKAGPPRFGQRLARA